MFAMPNLRAEASDRIIFKNGQEMEGFIVRRDADTITLRRPGGEKTISRTMIRRIDDTATSGAYIASASQKLPPWKAIVNDLRGNEDIHILRMVASGREADGPFAGSPYVAFEINDSINLRIYGDPGNPAGLQIGLRGAKAASQAERIALRSFFAGFLTQRSQIAALYALEMKGGEKAAGNLHLAFGTQSEDFARPRWWLMAWNPPAMQVASRDGDPHVIDVDHNWETGFFRDRDGNIHPLTPVRQTLAMSL